MRFGVLGTGAVGTAMASRLAQLGHEVTIGSRSAGGEKARAWVAQHAERAAEGTLADAAAFGQVVVNATAGTGSLEALRAAGEENLRGKVLIDIANPLQHDGFPPQLAVCNTDSLGEQIQREFPDTRVVKTLNTVNTSVMVNPQVLDGASAVFMCGNDDAAKQQVRELLQEIGWDAGGILDLGDISNARGTEMYLALWLRMMRTLGTPTFNIGIVRPA